MSKRRSIGERLKAARSTDARRAVLTDWAADWQRDQRDILRQIELAIGDDPRAMDWDTLCRAAGQLRAVTDKRFQGLTGVLARLTADESMP